MPGEIDETFQPSRLCSLLDHFAVVEDPREAPKVRCWRRATARPGLAAFGPIWSMSGPGAATVRWRRSIASARTAKASAPASISPGSAA
ncbi:hypothetical protein Y958_24030 [Nitrospirillum viridazoti CBAmc]|uniref:Uncharacterized protein n=1 Tax=Nitrospirillum viridazoti CBAmc TaxID=1441467 RepID=A0A248JZ48_9PROT|nr:hypothetical protein Y958_24030 [Nitrospirillum amazonense CBAmc]